MDCYCSKGRKNVTKQSVLNTLLSPHYPPDILFLFTGFLLLQLFQELLQVEGQASGTWPIEAHRARAFCSIH